MMAKKAKVRNEYYIKLPKQGVQKVSRSVYCYWYASRRRQKYQKEQERKFGVRSYEAYLQKRGHVAEEVHLIWQQEADEEMSPENYLEQKMIYERLYQELEKLPPEDQKLIFELFYACIGLRELARQEGVTHRAIAKKRDRILKNLAKMLEDLQ